MDKQEQFEIYKQKAREIGGRVEHKTTKESGTGFYYYRNYHEFGCCLTAREAWERLIEQLAVFKPGRTVMTSASFGRYVIPGSNINGLGIVSITQRYEVRQIDDEYQIFHLERRQCGNGPEDNRVASYILNELERTQFELNELKMLGEAHLSELMLKGWSNGVSKAIDQLKTASRGDMVPEDVQQNRLYEFNTRKPQIFKSISAAVAVVEASINDFNDAADEDRMDQLEHAQAEAKEAL